MKRRYERGGNKGFSLVELLVGVTILAVIITPLLSSLIASSKTAQKAREVRNATLAASNVIETFEAKPLKQLLTEITSGGIPGLGTHAALCQYDAENDAYAELGDPSAVKEGEDVYYIALRGISSSKDTFDALVKLDATKYPINQEPVTTYTDMDVVFSQPYAEEENPDALALASLANQATVLARRSVAASELSGKIIRNLTITVSLDPEDATTFTAKARYAYTAAFTYTGTDGLPVTQTLKEELEYDFFRGDVSKLTAIHFFFYPNYGTAGAYSDNITVENPDNLAFKLVLAKQRSTGLSEAQLLAGELGYRSSLILREPRVGSSLTPTVQISTNMNANLADETIPVAAFRYWVYKGLWYTNMTSATTGMLAASEAKNRIYAVTVDLFAAGADFGAAEPRLSIDASKVE